MTKKTGSIKPLVSAGKLLFSAALFKQYHARISKDESVWVRTHEKRNNWPVLSGRMLETPRKIIVIGHGHDDEWNDRFFWEGTAADFKKVWESDARMEPVRFEFSRAA